MPIDVVEFEEKRYTIAGAEFKLRKPTIGIKRRGAMLSVSMNLRLQEIVALTIKCTEDKNIDENNLDVFKELYTAAEQINNLSDEALVKAQELFKIILEPVKAGDESKLIADNFDLELLEKVATDFFQIAGVSIMPANN